VFVVAEKKNSRHISLGLWLIMSINVRHLGVGFGKVRNYGNDEEEKAQTRK